MQERAAREPEALTNARRSETARTALRRPATRRMATQSPEQGLVTEAMVAVFWAVVPFALTVDAMPPEDTPELIRGPIACPPWCNELHTDPMDITVEDGLIHVSADCAIAPGQGQPRVLFNLVSYENPQEGLRGPVLELTFDLGGEFVPPEYEAAHRGEVDDFIDQLERAAAVLRQWRTALPAR